MILSAELKKKYRKYAKEKGFSASFPKDQDAIKFKGNKRPGETKEQEIVSHAELLKNVLWIKPFTVLTHGINEEAFHMFMKWWIDVAQENNTPIIKLDIRLYDMGGNGAWYANEYLTLACSYGFKKLDCVNKKNMYTFELHMENVAVRKQTDEIDDAFKELKAEDITFYYETTPKFNIDNLNLFYGLRIRSWEGFSGDIYFSHSDQKILCYNAVYDEKIYLEKGNLTKKVKEMLIDIREKQKLATLVSAPCDYLYRYLQQFYVSIPKEVVENAMQEFVEAGYDYREIEKEAIRLIDELIKTNIKCRVQLGILEPEDSFIPFFNHYLVVTKHRQMHYASVVANREEMQTFFHNIINRTIAKKL